MCLKCYILSKNVSFVEYRLYQKFQGRYVESWKIMGPQALDSISLEGAGWIHFEKIWLVVLNSVGFVIIGGGDAA